jgi:hypothetical protein
VKNHTPVVAISNALLILLGLAAPRAAGGSEAGAPAHRYPGDERDFAFDLRSGTAGRRPFVFVDEADVAKIRERAADPAYAREIASLRAGAEKALTVEPPLLETAWWQEARGKPWADTYPEIYHHTCAVPVPGMVAALRLARASIATGEERFAARAAALFCAYLDYPFEAEHYDVGLNYAVWGIPALEVHDALHDRLPESERARADRFFARLLRAELRNDRTWIENGIGGGINNHLAWHKKAIAAIGISYGIPELTAFAESGPRSARDLLDLGLRDGGVWAESSLPYHFTALAGLADLLWLFHRHRIGPDPASMALAGGRSPRDLFAGIAQVLFPDRSVPPLGDCYGRRVLAPDAGPWPLAYALFGGDLFAWLIAEGGEPTPEQAWERLRFGVPPRPATPPPLVSTLLAEHGIVVLRSREGAGAWDGKGFTLLATYDRAGVHCHLDRLSMMLFGGGRVLLADREVVPAAEHSFSARIQRELNPHTLCHGTVLIDGLSQRANPEILDLIAYREAPGEKSATIADRRGVLYPGVRQSRSFCVADDHVLDVFQVVCEAPRTIAWIAHPEGRDLGPAGEPAPAPAADPAWRWIGGRERLPAGPLSFRYDPEGGGEDRLAIDLAPIEGAAAFRARFPASDPTVDPAGGPTRTSGRPILMVEFKTTRAVFAALYRLGRDIPPAAPKVFPPADGRLRVEIEAFGARHLVPALE